MFGAGLATLAVTAGLFAGSAVAQTVDPIVIKGNLFFYKTNGTQFYIKGVAYQQGVSAGGNASDSSSSYTDPLADASACDRDIPLIAALNTNTIRVYAIDPTKDHSHCMNLLQSNGIYVVADLSAPTISINRDDPEWNMNLYERYTNVVDSLSNYTNVIGFFAGNEVANNASNVDAIAFVKGAVRDTKSYIKGKNLGRDLYVGYAADDDSTIRVDIEDYLNCGPTTDDNIDFFGYNIYSWCGGVPGGTEPTFQTSGYADRTKELDGYSVPAFFAEYGCNTADQNGGHRDFSETAALFSDDMTGVWSGGIVYEYFQEANDYGLVSIDGSQASQLPDYSAYSTAIAKVSPTILNAASYTPTNTALRSCPAVNSAWAASPTLPPSPNQQLCDCMVSDLTCVAKGTPSDDVAGSLFDYICGGGTDCSGISGNGTSGKYGAYSMCDLKSRLSWAMNSYAGSHTGGNPCDFGGNATTVSAKAASSCSALVSQAGGVKGQGTSTAVPANNNGNSGSSSGSSGSSASSSKSAAGAVTVPSIDMGLVKLGAYVVCAVAAGAGVVLM